MIGYDPELVRMEGILHKLADDTPLSAFTPDEVALMRRMRENRDVILAQLYTIAKDAIAVNDRGRRKILALIRGVERICR